MVLVAYGRKEKTRSDLNRDATRVELHKARLARQSAEDEAEAARAASYLAYKESKKE